MMMDKHILYTTHLLEKPMNRKVKDKVGPYTFKLNYMRSPNACESGEMLDLTSLGSATRGAQTLVGLARCQIQLCWI